MEAPVFSEISGAWSTSCCKRSRREKGIMKNACFWPVYAGKQVAFVYAIPMGHKVVADFQGQGLDIPS